MAMIIALYRGINVSGKNLVKMESLRAMHERVGHRGVTSYRNICMSPLGCLHQWGAHEHPPLMSPEHAKPGNGLLLFFRVDDFSMALKRARALATRLEEEPRVNPNTGTMEFALRDPDGYYVMVSALSAAESSE